MFENRASTFNGSYENINKRKSLKEGVQNFIKGNLNETEFKDILIKNKINPENMEITKNIKLTALNGGQGKNLLTAVLKFNPEK
jgi:hypothetical protein